jgi:hypothetical protein
VFHGLADRLQLGLVHLGDGQLHATPGQRLHQRGDGCHALFLGNLYWAPEESVKADAIWKNQTQSPANAALLLCNLNSQVKGAKESALDAGGFGRLEDL